MILDPIVKSPGRRSPLVSHIVEEVGNTVGDVAELQAHNVEEVATAVEHFLQTIDSDSCVDSRYLVVLASQALSSVGEDAAARRLVIFGTGLIRPQEWEFAGDETLWVLDLRKMTLRGSDCFEMIFFNSLVAVLDSIADVWDKTSGKGVLALKHVCSVAETIIGGSGQKAVNSLAAEILGFCSRKLEKTGAERGWSQTPRIVNIDS